mmetsp:Transcript_24287/g.36004  ORF Transcript_24287/g.36004 Transcript_24287/m.36004 type:complete len:125 (+) Transcript_24287:4224-4598(+)|eukprot:5741541-Ditylum_brightwellii.AAC.1
MLIQHYFTHILQKAKEKHIVGNLFPIYRNYFDAALLELNPYSSVLELASDFLLLCACFLCTWYFISAQSSIEHRLRQYETVVDFNDFMEYAALLSTISFPVNARVGNFNFDSEEAQKNARQSKK